MDEKVLHGYARINEGDTGNRDWIVSGECYFDLAEAGAIKGYAPLIMLSIHGMQFYRDKKSER